MFFPAKLFWAVCFSASYINTQKLLYSKLDITCMILLKTISQKEQIILTYIRSYSQLAKGTVSNDYQPITLVLHAIIGLYFVFCVFPLAAKNGYS